MSPDLFVAPLTFVERKTFAVFLYGGDKVQKSNTLTLSLENEVPPGDVDPAVPTLGGPPKDAIGVRFYDQIVAEVEDPSTKEKVICRSDWISVLEGTTYYGGTLYSLADVKNGAANLPLLTHQVVLGSGWAHTIVFEDGSVAQFHLNQDRQMTPHKWQKKRRGP